MYNPELILNAFITLFVTIDPIGNAPIFLGLTAGFTTADSRKIAIRGVSIAFVILVLFSLTGTIILDAMGISVAAFRVAGGLLLFYTAFEMIFAQRQERREKTSASAVKEQIANIAVFPLAIPLLAGPGTISATILLSSELSSGTAVEFWWSKLILIGIILSIMIVSVLIFFAANFFDKYLGNTGRLVLARLLGVLLAALSVEYVASGSAALFSAY